MDARAALAQRLESFVQDHQLSSCGINFCDAADRESRGEGDRDQQAEMGLHRQKSDQETRCGRALVLQHPAAALVKWIVYTIKKIDASANTVTIDADAGELIDGVLTQVLTTQWQAVRIQSDGTGWIII